MSTYPTLGTKIKYFRERAGQTQIDLEFNINAAFGAVSRIETDKINPTRETLNLIARALNMTQVEIDYTYGDAIYPATEAEINAALAVTHDYFENEHCFAYLLDERSRMHALSKGFRNAAEVTNDQMKNVLGKTMPQIIIDDSLPIHKLLDPKHYKEDMYYAFARTYAEMAFMIGDPYYNQIMYWINKDPDIREMWTEFSQGGEKLLPYLNTRNVTFYQHGLSIPMSYSLEHLYQNRRFCILEYKPTKLIMRLVQKLIK